MGWQRAKKPSLTVLPAAEPNAATVRRPLDDDEDTGLRFTGWYIAANNSLTIATRDKDPGCMKLFCSEARVAAQTARQHALNDRQRLVADKLLEAIAAVRAIAEETPPLP